MERGISFAGSIADQPDNYAELAGGLWISVASLWRCSSSSGLICRRAFIDTGINEMAQSPSSITVVDEPGTAEDVLWPAPAVADPWFWQADDLSEHCQLDGL